MAPEQRQREFIPLFLFLLVLDAVATYVITYGAEEFGLLCSLWFGPLDDIFYTLAGIQALYFLLDPRGTTREEGEAVGTIETVKRSGRLLGNSEQARDVFASGFYEGSRRAVGGLTLFVVGLWLARLTLGTPLAHALLLISERHLLFVFPIVALLAGLVRLLLKRSAPSQWSGALAFGLVVIVAALTADERWENHLVHLFLSLETLQAWGAAFCWVGLGARLGSVAHRT